MMIIAIVLICLVNVVLGHEAYEEACTSPIDLNPKEATCSEGNRRPKVVFGGTFSGVITNNKWGSSVLVSLPKEAANNVKVKIGDKEYNYLPDYHFHWGNVSTESGSEHTDDGKRHDIEMHLASNLTNSDGTIGGNLSALTFFIDETDGPDNAAFSHLTNVLLDLKKAGETHQVESNLKDIVGTAIDGEFYQYTGTPFLPPCNVAVIWTIYKTPLQISKAQMEAFRGARVAGSFKPIQPLNKRELYSSKC